MAPTTDTDSKIDTKGISDSRKGARRSEPSFEMLSNFSRVTPMQLPYIAFNTDGRYHPLTSLILNLKGLLQQQQLTKRNGTCYFIGSNFEASY